MILTKDHAPGALALGTTNSLSELFQMIGIAVGAPLVRCVPRLPLCRCVDTQLQFAVCVLDLDARARRAPVGRRHLRALVAGRLFGEPDRAVSVDSALTERTCGFWMCVDVILGFCRIFIRRQLLD